MKALINSNRSGAFRSLTSIGAKQTLRPSSCPTPVSYGRQALAQLQQSQHIPAHLADLFVKEAEQMLDQVEAIWQQVDANDRTRDLHLGNLQKLPMALVLLILMMRAWHQPFKICGCCCMVNAMSKIFNSIAAWGLSRVFDFWQQAVTIDRTLKSPAPVAPLFMDQSPLGWSNFPQHFPWFSEDGYWQQQIQFFQEQQQALATPSLQLTLY